MRAINSNSPRGLRDYFECVRARAMVNNQSSEPRDRFVARQSDGSEKRHILSKQVAVAAVLTRQEAPTGGGYPSALYKTTLQRVWGGRDRLVQELFNDNKGVMTYKLVEFSSEKFNLCGKAGDEYQFVAQEKVLTGTDAQAQAQRLEAEFQNAWNSPRRYISSVPAS